MLHGVPRRAAFCVLGIACMALVAVPSVQLVMSASALATAPSPSCGSVVVSGSTAVVTCSYSGGPQYFVVPAGVSSVLIDAYGAQGGGPELATNTETLFLQNGGTPGGYTEAVLRVGGGQSLQVNVGGAGGNGFATAAADSSSASAIGGSAGWNGGQCGDDFAGLATDTTSTGGGLTCASSAVTGAIEACAALPRPGISPGCGGLDAALAVAAGGSGGASDVRQGGTATSDRVVVAGGAGGSGACELPIALSGGGEGGGSTGGSGVGSTNGAGGGTQMAGGAGGSPGGLSAVNDQGAPSVASDTVPSVPLEAGVGGPGGAGWFGGGSGSGSATLCGGGGGGSSFPPNAAILEQGVHDGNGLVKITFTLASHIQTTDPSYYEVTYHYDCTIVLPHGHVPLYNCVLKRR
jgi:hypothetical protein